MHDKRQIPIAEPSIGAVEEQYVLEAVRSGWVSSRGPFVTRFEEEIRCATDARFAVATCNGTAALHLALAALRIGPGDEVIVPSLSFVATANAVHYVGADAVFADCDRRTWCLDPADVEQRITPRTKAIVPVHLYGHPAPMDDLAAIAERYGLHVVEDAAQALGATYRGRKAGALGDVSMFSFFGNKILTTGEGGMLITNDADIADRARFLCNHGMSRERRYWHPEVGFNYRMTNLQAALGSAQFTRLPEFLQRKRAIAAAYRDALETIPGLTLQCEAPDVASSWWMSTIAVDPESRVDRDGLIDALAARGIETRPGFFPIHVMPPYATGLRLPVTEAIAATSLSLPSSVTLTPEDQEFVIAALQDIAGVAVNRLAPAPTLHAAR
jgi:perosamine synthetase